jgi:hypothetical protein
MKNHQQKEKVNYQLMTQEDSSHNRPRGGLNPLIFRAIINSQSMVASIGENVTIEYRPIYERLSEFMMGEMLLPRGSNPN